MRADFYLIKLILKTYFMLIFTVLYFRKHSISVNFLIVLCQIKSYFVGVYHLFFCLDFLFLQINI